LLLGPYPGAEAAGTGDGAVIWGSANWGSTSS